jgi:hypothetical protein
MGNPGWKKLHIYCFEQGRRDIFYTGSVHLREGVRMEHEIKGVIRECDLAIKQEEFDALMDYYCEDAILVVKPGRIARGKQEIKDAFIKISQYFHNTLANTGRDADFRSWRHCLGSFPDPSGRKTK